MHLELSSEDARGLYELLEAYLPELRRETARTDAHALRHRLVQRQELCERLLARLSEPGVIPASPAAGPD